MSKLLIAMCDVTEGLSLAHAAVWVREGHRLDKVREALRVLQAEVPGTEEVVLQEGEGCGVTARFGDLDLGELAELDPDAVGCLEDDHVGEIQDPEAPIDSVLEETEEDFGSVRVHVRLDCWYVSARFDGGEGRAESSRFSF